MKDFQKYKRTNVAEMIKLSDYNLFTLSELLAETTVSVSAPDQELAPDVFKLGYIARNPNDHEDMWYVSKKYFDENFAPMDEPVVMTGDSIVKSLINLEPSAKDLDFNKAAKDWADAAKSNVIAVGYDGLNSEKTLDNTSIADVKLNVSDVVVWGDGDTFKLISKASSKKQGWMKSCKAMEIEGMGCVIQVTTQQNQNVAEALVFVPNTRIDTMMSHVGEDATVVGRKVVRITSPSIPTPSFDIKGNAK